MDLNSGETQTGAMITESATEAWKVNAISQNGQRQGQLRTELREHHSLSGVRRERKHCLRRKEDEQVEVVRVLDTVGRLRIQ